MDTKCRDGGQLPSTDRHLKSPGVSYAAAHKPMTVGEVRFPQQLLPPVLQGTDFYKFFDKQAFLHLVTVLMAPRD